MLSDTVVEKDHPKIGEGATIYMQEKANSKREAFDTSRLHVNGSSYTNEVVGRLISVPDFPAPFSFAEELQSLLYEIDIDGFQMPRVREGSFRPDEQPQRLWCAADWEYRLWEGAATMYWEKYQGVVHFKEGRCCVTAKRCDVAHMSETQVADNMLKDIAILREFCDNAPCCNLLKLVDVVLSEEDGSLFSIYEQYLSLERYFDAHMYFESEGVPRDIFRGVLLGLKHIHSQGICHRNVHEHSIGICHDTSTRKWKAVITEFGCCTRMDKRGLVQNTGPVGIFRNCAPEMFATKEEQPCYNGVKVDLWAFGVTLLHAMTGYPQGYGYEFRQNVLNGQFGGTFGVPTFENKAWWGSRPADNPLTCTLTSLIIDVLLPSIDKPRPENVEQVLKHPFFEQVP